MLVQGEVDALRRLTRYVHRGNEALVVRMNERPNLNKVIARMCDEG